MRPLGNCVWSALLHLGPETFVEGTHLLAARLARVLVAVTCIFELRAALEVFENQLVRSAAHVQPQS